MERAQHKDGSPIPPPPRQKTKKQKTGVVALGPVAVGEARLPLLHDGCVPSGPAQGGAVLHPHTPRGCM